MRGQQSGFSLHCVSLGLPGPSDEGWAAGRDDVGELMFAKMLGVIVRECYRVSKGWVLVGYERRGGFEIDGKQEQEDRQSSIVRLQLNWP